MEWMELIHWLIDSIGDIGKVVIKVTAIIFLFEGSKRLFSKEINRQSVLMLIFGLLICFGWSVVNFMIADGLEIIEPIDKEIFKDLPDDWALDIDPEKRASNSKNLAAMYYREYGEIGTYFDINGERLSYCPTAEDIETRDEMVTLFCQKDYVVNLGNANGWRWIIYIMTTILLGWSASRKMF